MKKLLALLLFPLMILLTAMMIGCSKEERVLSVKNINRQLVFIERKDLLSSQRQRLSEHDMSIEGRLIGDTLRCKVLTSRIFRNDSLKSIVSEKKGNQLSIHIVSSPNDVFLPNDSDIIASEVSFDLLGINAATYEVFLEVNQYGRSPIRVKIERDKFTR